MSFQFELEPSEEFVAERMDLLLQGLRHVFEEKKRVDPEFSQQRIADFLQVDKSVISRRLNTGANVTFKTFLEMLYAMDGDVDLRTFLREVDSVTYPRNAVSVAPSISVLQRDDGGSVVSQEKSYSLELY